MSLSDGSVKEVVNALREHLGSDLVAVVLYGSWARGTARPASDVDLFVVAHNLPQNRLDRARYIHRAVVERFDRRVSILAKEPVEFERFFPSLYLDIGLDGITLYDPQGYMCKRLARIREIIQEAGLYRVCRDGELMWLWKRRPARRWAIEWEGFRESD